MQRSPRDRESPLDADATAPDVSTIRVRGRPWDARLGSTLGAVAVLIILAILKPWGLGSPSATLRPDLTVAPTRAPITPIPTEDRSSDGLAAPICLGTGAWRIASLESWRTQDVRVWRAIAPIAEVTGPLDPAIPSVPIVAVEIAALGWCAPAFGPDRPVGPVNVTATFIRGDVASGLELLQVHPTDGSTPIAALYVPLLPAGAPGRWETGRVVFRYRDSGTGRVLWLAADITILPPGADATLTAGSTP